MIFIQEEKIQQKLLPNKNLTFQTAVMISNYFELVEIGKIIPECARNDHKQNLLSENLEIKRTI